VQQTTEVVQQAAPPMDAYSASVARLALDSADAAARQAELADAALSAQAASQAAAFGGQSDSFSQAKNLAALQQADDASKTSRDKQAADAEKAAQEQERA